MANDPKNPPVIDDWDSLPLDPEADDWDSVAPPVTGSGARPAPTSSAVGPVRSPLDSFDADEVATTAASAAEDLAGAGFDQVDFDQDESPSSQAGGGEARDDFDDLGEEDDFLDLSPIEVETPAPGTWLASPEEDSLDATGQPTSLPKAAPRPDDSLDAPVTPEPITPKPGSAGQGSGAANAAESLDSGAGQANLDSFDFEEVLKTAAEPATQAKASPPQAAKASDSGEADKSAPGSQDPARDDFLKSLIDSDDENVPKKVELDLDGIFSEAKKEAEQLSPEATHMPEEAPTAAPLEKKEEASTGEPRAKAQVVRVARYKLYLLISMVFVGLAGLGFGVYQIFLKSPVVVPPPPKDEFVLIDDLAIPRVRVPGVYPLERFFISLGQEPNKVVVEMEIILHYQDEPVKETIRSEMVVIRDMIFLLTRAMDPSILTELEERRQLQANLLTTLNNLPPFRSDPTDPALTYVQISLLKKR